MEPVYPKKFSHVGVELSRHLCIRWLSHWM